MPLASQFDLLVVGGGINGAGIARDAAGRGLRVLLVEKDDLASATSSASSKLIHGGLRYLEHYEFRLVGEALSEREILLTIAPHLVHALDFVLPHPAGAPRPAWLVRLGLYLYDLLAAGSRLRRSRALDLTRDPAGRPLKDAFSKGFSYPDCRVDDARLVVGNVTDAVRRGGTVRIRTRLESATREGKIWRATLRGSDGAAQTVAARAIVNAAGPWVGDVLKDAVRLPTQKNLRLVKGSHIVVPAAEPLSSAYILQNDDRRVVFVIPYQDRFNLIGTTDIPYQGDPAAASCSAEEIEYLCRAVGRYFRHSPTPADVVWSFAGVRPLFDDRQTDPSKVTRDYTLETDAGPDGYGAPAISVFGGKLTTYRRLAEKVMETLAPFFPGLGSRWTARAPLPGGAFGGRGGEAVFEDLVRDYPAVGRAALTGIFRRHGTLAREVLGDAHNAADLGHDFGGGLFAREAAYFKTGEWATRPDDVLWRRSKCGLAMTETERRAFAEAFARLT
ncbi:MAG: glycerol-3-phosphate dehydrogenase [Alphaproteobacteria bacterium]|nr:glycerol-3-phosphate dehydrogenase [Alphaproteobacteria bacterium]